MIRTYSYLQNSLGKVMYFCLLLAVIASPLLAQSEGTKELDQILRQELGEKTTTPNETEKNETSPTKTEENPIQERYTDVNDDSPSATWILLKILFVLSILVGAGYYLILQMQKTKQAKYPVKGFMRVLSSLPLSQSQSVQIVEVGGRLLVLGVAEGSVSLVSEITAAEEKNEILKLKEEADPYVPNFLESLLESLQSKAQKKIRINKSQIESSDFDLDNDVQKKAKESLERLRKHREMLEGGTS
ncbi:flagellar biosynthetic protein FliO [Leptospira sp. 96542]|nr:flagellar biosynthetic protein FliO [Leptospira sp. 96542]